MRHFRFHGDASVTLFCEIEVKEKRYNVMSPRHARITMGNRNLSITWKIFGSSQISGRCRLTLVHYMTDIQCLLRGALNLRGINSLIKMTHAIILTCKTPHMSISWHLPMLIFGHNAVRMIVPRIVPPTHTSRNAWGSLQI